LLLEDIERIQIVGKLERQIEGFRQGGTRRGRGAPRVPGHRFHDDVDRAAVERNELLLTKAFSQPGEAVTVRLREFLQQPELQRVEERFEQRALRRFLWRLDLRCEEGCQRLGRIVSDRDLGLDGAQRRLLGDIGSFRRPRDSVDESAVECARRILLRFGNPPMALAEHRECGTRLRRIVVDMIEPSCHDVHEIGRLSRGQIGQVVVKTE
jgi:hypothetical protein